MCWRDFDSGSSVSDRGGGAFVGVGVGIGIWTVALFGGGRGGIGSVRGVWFCWGVGLRFRSRWGVGFGGRGGRRALWLWLWVVVGGCDLELLRWCGGWRCRAVSGMTSKFEVDVSGSDDERDEEDAWYSFILL